MRRVPITAPPTRVETTITSTTTTTTTTTTTSATTATTWLPEDTSKLINNQSLVSAAPVYIGHPGGESCGQQRLRGVTWPQLPLGHNVEIQCPNNPRLLAVRLCNETSKRWDDPDLSRCQSVWMVNLVRSSGLFDPSRVANELDLQLAMFPLYGGDILASIDLVSNLTSYLDQWPVSNPAIIMELVGRMLHSFSTLLEAKSSDVWRDLPASMVKTSQNKLVEVVDTISQVFSLKIGHEAATISTNNICKSMHIQLIGLRH